MSTPSSGESRAGSGFTARAVVAAAVVVVFAGLAWADAVGLGGAPAAWWLLPVAVVVAARGAAEFAGLFAAAGVPVRGSLVQFATVAIALSAAAGAPASATPAAALGWTAVACTFAVVLLGAASLRGYRPGERRLEALAAGVFAAVSLGLPLAFMIALRLLDPGAVAAEPTPLGILPLVSMVAVVKAGDVAAYAAGTLVGRHRMAPILSPGKTWEGAAASLAASVAAAWVVLAWASPAGPWGGWPVFGLLVGAAGMIGDLAESLVKRELGAKDSGRLLGGLGGVLDLVDSLLPAAPVAWVLWVLGR